MLVGFGQKAEEIAHVQFPPCSFGADVVGLDPLCESAWSISEVADLLGDRRQEGGDVRLADGADFCVDRGDHDDVSQRLDVRRDRYVGVRELGDEEGLACLVSGEASDGGCQVGETDVVGTGLCDDERKVEAVDDLAHGVVLYQGWRS